MNGIGSLIRLLREAKNLSRIELAEGICSSKYIYFIEKGARIPSAEIINAIGVKLNTDIFDYMPYLDCQEPLSMKLAMDTFNRLRNATDYRQLSEVTRVYETLSDFAKSPWKAEIVFNKIAVSLFEDGSNPKVKQAIDEEIIRLGGQLVPEPNHPVEAKLQLIRYYNMLAVYYLTNQLPEMGYPCMDYVYNQLKSKRQLKQFQPLYESAALNWLNTLITRRRFEDLNREASDFLGFQMENELHGRVYLTYFLMAQGAFEMDRLDLAAKYMKKCLYLGIAIGNDKHLNVLLGYGFVKKLRESGVLQIDLISEFTSA